MKSRIEIILDNTPFPGAGQEIGGYKVNESVVDITGKNWAIYLQGKLSATQVKKALSTLTGKHFALPVQDEFSLIRFDSKGMTHARTNPPGDVTVVRGHMYYARPNPISSKDFQAEMDEMLIDNPDKFFTKYTVRNKDELHERLWKGVSYAGESYGWKKGDELYHRRASFIMPKIKINKALKGATMFYHTHPAKDEPSLTSADDIQFYLDLHFAYGIKSFYTIMKHKLDHFTITGKPGGKEKYLRMEEDAFIDTVDGMIADGEKVAKKEVGEDRPEVEFQNRITKEMVDLFNKKYKSIAKISFRAKSKNPASKLAKGSSFNPISALTNPAPNPPIKVEDQYIAKALDELKGLDYAHEHYGADEYGHTMYVYWWLKHHLAPTPKQPKGRLYKLQEFGLDQESRRKVRDYLSQSIIGNYTYMDAVYLMALYHDIAKLREKGTKKPGWEIGAEMFRNEIGPELGLPSKLVEDIAFLFDTDLGRKGIKDEDFMTQAGDYYGAAKLVQMSDMITHHPTMYTGSARKAKGEGKIGMASGKKYKEYIMTELINDLRVFLDHHYVIQNPPPKPVFVKWVADYGIGDLVYEEVDELLGEFHQSVIPDENGKTKQDNDKSSGGHLYYMRFNSAVVPGISRIYTANFALSSSKILINVGRPVPDDLGKKDATLIYEAVGRRLQESYPEVEIEEVEPEAIVNPRKANKIQVISLSGPSGGGKSTVMRYLNKHIPNSSTPPTYTTRPRRPTDGKDRVFVSKTQFKEMLAQGQFVEYTVSGNGHYYGRRFKDFKGNVAIIEVSLDGKKHYEKRFANLFTVYLDPDPSITEEERAKAIFKRGGLTKEEAKRRAKKATETIAKSKKMQFDLRVTMMKGKYDEGAKKILSQIPLTNPVVAPRILPTPLQAANITRAENGLVPITRDEYIRNVRQQAAETAQNKFYSDTREINQWNREQPRILESSPSMRPFVGTQDDFGELDTLAPAGYNATLPRGQNYGIKRIAGVDPHQRTLPFQNPKKELFDWFKDWVELVNMKNKELKTFLDSDWGAVAGLSPQEAKDWNNIKSGRVSGRRILKMRKKLGLTGPKDYIDPNKPRVLEDYYEKALNKWTGPSDDMQKGETDWDWCKRQVRFNKRFMGDVFGERKGPLVRKQKTQNQPSRRLLSLWVWGHDPWRYARKVEKRERMPKCPSVPWVGMTEKRKWGVIEVIPGPKKNPAWPEEWQQNPYVTLTEPWTGMEVMIDEEIAPLIQAMWSRNIQTMNSNQATRGWGYIAIKGSFDKIKAIVPDMELHQPAMQIETDSGVSTSWGEEASDDLRNKGYMALFNVQKGAHSEHPIMGPMWDTDYVIFFTKKGQNALHSAFGIPLPNPPMKLVEVKEHKQVLLEKDKKSIPVDELMAPLIKHLWANGVQTLFSCQGEDFDNPDGSLTPFPEYEGVVNEPDFYDEDGNPLFLHGGFTGGYLLMVDGFDYVAHRLSNIIDNDPSGREGPTSWEGEFSYLDGGQIWLESDYHQFGKMSYPKPILTVRWRGKKNYENLRRIYKAFGLQFPEIKKNPLRKKECPLPPKKGIIIYGASYCVYCTKAREYLDKKKKKYTYVDINKVKNYRKNIFPLTDNYEYIPVIFINGKFIGGYSELIAKKNPKPTCPSGKKSFDSMEDAEDHAWFDGRGQTAYGPCERILSNGKVCGKYHLTSSRSNPPRPHDGDAIITVNEVPWGTQIIAECPFDGTKGAIDSSMEDACNHIYPPCGHVLRINPDKPCCCENSEHPPTHPDHWPNTRDNPHHCPIEAEARRAATDPSFKHHEWYIEHHLDYVMAIAKSIVNSDEPEDQQLIHDMVWMHDYPKMLGDKDNYELVRELVSKHRSERYTDRLMNQLRWMEAIKSPDWNGRATTIAAVMSTADALAHYYGPFFQIFHDENPDTPIAELKKKNRAKLEKDKRKLRAGPRRTALDNVRLQYKGRKVRVTGNEHIAELIERKNPRTKKGRKFPSKYLKGLTATERAIAKYEIDRGYEYSMDDPKAYEDWKSDIKAKARGLKTLPSKWRNKFARKYGTLKDGYDFLDRISKTTGVKRKYLKKIQDKGLAAWRVGHRPGVTQMQWARGRVYAFVMAAPSSTGPGKPDHKLAVEAGVR